MQEWGQRLFFMGPRWNWAVSGLVSLFALGLQGPRSFLCSSLELMFDNWALQSLASPCVG